MMLARLPASATEGDGFEPLVGTTTTPVDRYDAILLTETVRENEILTEFVLGYGDSASAEAALPSVEAMLAAGGPAPDESFGELFSGASATLAVRRWPPPPTATTPTSPRERC